ncbi:MAG: hypothetical protein Q8P24_17000 [Desulfobacterales bacterium]|nr:hypothetical protein [Desulfobacterales bacterium]
MNGFIAPGEIVEMPEARANFVLTAIGQRGLVQMNFGDDPEAKKKLSMDLYRSFWDRQIQAHNQHNMNMRDQGNRYVQPTKEIEAHAKDLGLDILRQDWFRTDNRGGSNGGDVKALKEENVVLKTTLTGLQDQMALLMKMMQQKIEPSVDAPLNENPSPVISLVGEVESNRNKYKRLGESNMKGWLGNNWDDVHVMPKENQFEIKAKYEELYQTPYPTERPV